MVLMKITGFVKNATIRFWQNEKQLRLPHKELIQGRTVTHQEHETSENDKENKVQTANSTNTRTGQPKVTYTEASAATKRRIKAKG